MNFKKFRQDTVGTLVRLLPRPTYDGQVIRHEHNLWLVVDEVQEGEFLFQNRTTRSECKLRADNIQEFRTPNLVILRGQVLLKGSGETDFEASAPGLIETEGLEALIDRSHWGEAKTIYEALKQHEGERVTLRFPDKDDWQFGSEEVVLEKCTPHYVTLRRLEMVFKMKKLIVQPYDLSGELTGSQEPKYELRCIPDERRVTEKIASVPLQYLSLAEDVENGRPLLMFDHSLWDKTT